MVGYLSLSAIAPRMDNGHGGSDRGFIAGRSGSGKSYLARNLLALYGPDKPRPFRSYLIIIDPNHNFDFPSSSVVTEPSKDAVPTKQRPIIHYRPSVDAANAESWNELFRLLFQSRDRILAYVDELYALEPLFRKVALDSGRNWFNAFLTQGRARGKGAIMTAQRPVSIPRNVIAQAEWFYVFDLPVKDDRQVMAGTIGDISRDGEDTRDREALQRYEFWFLGPDTRKPIRMKINA